MVRFGLAQAWIKLLTIIKEARKFSDIEAAFIDHKNKKVYTGEHPCRSVIPVTMQSNFIKITLWLGCSPENLLHIFRTPFPENTSGGLLLNIENIFPWGKDSR